MTTPAPGLQVITVNALNPGTVLVSKGDGATLIINMDFTTTLWLSRNVSVIAARPQDSIPLAPQASITVDGTDDVFGITTGPTISVSLIPGGFNYSPSPAQVATQIALSGINSAAPKFLQTLGTFAVGATWGPINVAMPSGGAYMITVGAAASTAGTDVTVDHLDATGNVVYEEFFGAVSNIFFGGAIAPTIIRGNVQGVTLRIKGQVCSAAFFSTASGIIGGQSVTLNVYSLPFALANDIPKIITAGFGSGVTAAAGLLLSVDSLAVAFGVTSIPSPNVTPYAGPVTVSFRATGVTVAANGRLNLNFWSMAQFLSTGQPLGTVRFMSTGSLVETQISYNLPCAFCSAAIANTDPAQNGVFFAHITAGAYA